MTDALVSTCLAPMTTAEALDAAFAGQSCELVSKDGSSRPLPIDRWTGRASTVDVALFVSRCTGPTLDVGCGPGRLSGALWDREVNVLGLDISSEAVRQTKQRGAPALCLDIFDAPRGTGLWDHVLLADGNIGLGGRPEALLQLVATLVKTDGTVLVELAGTGECPSTRASTCVWANETAHRSTGPRSGSTPSRTWQPPLTWSWWTWSAWPAATSPPCGVGWRHEPGRRDTA